MNHSTVQTDMTDSVRGCVVTLSSTYLRFMINYQGHIYIRELNLKTRTTSVEDIQEMEKAASKGGGTAARLVTGHMTHCLIRFFATFGRCCEKKKRRHFDVWEFDEPRHFEPYLVDVLRGL
jgi:hypothetical protein